MKRVRARKSETSKMVANNIVARRKTLGISQKIAAERCHIKYERYLQLEKGINIFENAITVLRVAEGLGVTYDALYDNAKNKKIRTATIPIAVWHGIAKILVERSISRREFSELVGCSTATLSTWLDGKVAPSPLFFNNVLQVLRLKASDLEKMVDAEKPKMEPLPQEEVVPIMELPEPIPEFVKAIEASEQVETKTTDPVEERVVKLMKLQARMDDVLDKLWTITETAFKLHEELKELKGA